MELNKFYLGDCLEIVKTLPSESIDLIVTSPPYADKRKSTYGSVHADDYVEWFLLRAEEFKRVLKPSGTFIFNIKEGASNGERLTHFCIFRNDNQFIV